MQDGVNSSQLKEQRQTLRDRGICVVIPTYNNGSTVEDIVERALLQCADVIVVDDGCTDNTANALQQLSDIYESLHVVTLRRNKGKGAALKAGFRKAKELGFAYAITLDSDGQHFPEDIPLMLKANQENPGALIVGERQNLEKMERSGGSKFANKFSNFWFWVQTGYNLKDTQTGYRLYPLRKLHGLWLLTSRYEAELELMVFAAWHGVRLVSTPVNVFYPPREERVSHFRPGIDFTRIFILNTILCGLAVVYGLPLRVLRFVLMILRTVYSLLFFSFFSLAVVTPFTMLYLKIGKETDEKKLRLHKLLNFMLRFIVFYHKIPGVKISIGNNSGETFEKPAVVICNHQSHLDLMMLLAVTPKMIVLTKDWVWNNPFYGYIIHKAEFYPISAGLDNIMGNLKSLVDRGYSIAVYPEGTRSPDCRIGRFHQGAFYLAKSLGVDVVPLVLYGAGKVLPKKGRHLNKGIIRLEIDKRRSVEELNGMGTLKETASAFRKYYKDRYTEMCNKIEQNV